MISAAGEASYYYKDYKLISGFFSRAQGQMAVSMSLWLAREGAIYSVAEFTAVNSQLSIWIFLQVSAGHERLHPVLSEDKRSSPHPLQEEASDHTHSDISDKKGAWDSTVRERRPSSLGLLASPQIPTRAYFLWLAWSRKTYWIHYGDGGEKQGRDLTLVTDAGQMWKGSLTFTVSSFIPTVKKWLLKSAWSYGEKDENIKRNGIVS